MILTVVQRPFRFPCYQRLDGVFACTVLYIGTGVRSSIVIKQTDGIFEKQSTEKVHRQRLPSLRKNVESIY